MPVIGGLRPCTDRAVAKSDGYWSCPHVAGRWNWSEVRLGAQTPRTDVSMFWHLFPRRGALSGLTRCCGLFGCWCVGNPDCMGLYRRRARRRLVGSGLQCPEPPRRREHRLYAPLGAGASAPAFGGAIASSSRNVPAARSGVVCSAQSPALTPATSARLDSPPREISPARWFDEVCWPIRELFRWKLGCTELSGWRPRRRLARCRLQCSVSPRRRTHARWR